MPVNPLPRLRTSATKSPKIQENPISRANNNKKKTKSRSASEHSKANIPTNLQFSAPATCSMQKKQTTKQ